MRPKTLHIIAGLVLINLLWVAYSWMTWVPKDVIEVAEGPTAEMLDQHGVHWRFNLDMVDDQHVGKPPLVPPTMTPAVAGAWTWADRRTLTFTPDKDFPLATAFALHVDAKALRSVNGFVLAHALDAVVRTPALMVTSVTVTSFAADGVADVLLSFNQPVDPDRIAKQLQVTPPVAAVADDAGATAQSGHAAATASAVTTAASAPVIPSSTPGPTQLPLHAATRPDIAIASLTHTPARAIHLLISGANVDLHATHLTLPQGVVGISGPRGLPSAWHEDVQLGHQQAITAISAVAPTHGPCTLHVAVANPGIALDLLIHGITVHPQVAYSVAHTATGFDLVGDFTPGTTYQCTLPARWPEAQPTSTLACYPAGASLQVPIPARQSGFWPIGTGLLEGQLQIGARGANHATVAISRMDTPTDSTLLSTTPLSWTVDPDHKEGMVQLDCDALLAGLADGKYVMCVHAATTQPMEDLAIPIQITHHGVRPLRTIRSLGTWIERGCTGDVMIRIASLDSDR